MTAELIRDAFGVEVSIREHPTRNMRVPLPIARRREAQDESEAALEQLANPERRPSPHAG
jgi:hypothetical protein